MDGIYNKIILVTLNQPFLIIKELVLKGKEMVVGLSKIDQSAVLSSNNGKNVNRCRLLVCTKGNVNKLNKTRSLSNYSIFE